METSESTKNIFTALSKAQSEIGHAKFDSTNPHFRNDYASLESCIDAIKKALSDNGLSLVQCMGRHHDGSNMLTSLVTHISGEFVKFEAPLILGKQDMQGIGSAISYQRRYSLQAIFNMGDTDDDGNASVGTSSKNGEYIIPFGKFKDKTIAEAGLDECLNYASWLHKSLSEKGEKPKPEAEQFFAEVKKARSK